MSDKFRYEVTVRGAGSPLKWYVWASDEKAARELAAVDANLGSCRINPWTAEDFTASLMGANNG